MHRHVPTPGDPEDVTSTSIRKTPSTSDTFGRTPEKERLEPDIVAFAAYGPPALGIAKIVAPTDVAVNVATLAPTHDVPAAVTVVERLASVLRGAPASPFAIATGLSRNACIVVAKGKAPTATSALLILVHAMRHHRHCPCHCIKAM
jgi:hypothetical protein